MSQSDNYSSELEPSEMVPLLKFPNSSSSNSFSLILNFGIFSSLFSCLILEADLKSISLEFWSKSIDSSTVSLWASVLAAAVVSVSLEDLLRYFAIILKKTTSNEYKTNSEQYMATTVWLMCLSFSDDPPMWNSIKYSIKNSSTHLDIKIIKMLYKVNYR